MTNYYQKILLLCILLLGCVLTSIGVECFSKTDEPVLIPSSTFIQGEVNSNVSTKNKRHINLITEQLVREEDKSNFQSEIQNKNINNHQSKAKSITQLKHSTQSSESTQPSPKLQIVNINTATEAELDTLPGIGPAIAKRIIAFRNQQAFSKPEDIMLVKGIGKKKFAKLRERITVE